MRAPAILTILFVIGENLGEQEPDWVLIDVKDETKGNSKEKIMQEDQ